MRKSNIQLQTVGTFSALVLHCLSALSVHRFGAGSLQLSRKQHTQLKDFRKNMTEENVSTQSYILSGLYFCSDLTCFYHF